MSASAPTNLPPTERTTVKRLADRSRYDRATIYSILDEARICHLGFVVNRQPFVIPTVHARLDDTVYVHGSPASRMLRTLKGGIDACLTVTLVDGLVLARSAFHHSVNYRSVVVLGLAAPVADLDRKRIALEAVVDHILPGRSAEARAPTDKELRATSVLAMSITEASAKVRTGAPRDDTEDYELPIWAGVVPLTTVAGSPEPDGVLPDGIAVPPSVTVLISKA